MLGAGEDARLAGGKTGLAVVSCLSFAADADHLSPTGYLLVSLLLFIFGLVVVLLYFLGSFLARTGLPPLLSLVDHLCLPPPLS